MYRGAMTGSHPIGRRSSVTRSLIPLKFSIEMPVIMSGRVSRTEVEDHFPKSIRLSSVNHFRGL